MALFLDISMFVVALCKIKFDDDRSADVSSTVVIALDKCDDKIRPDPNPYSTPIIVFRRVVPCHWFRVRVAL